jgi:hypothetical protein
MAHARLVAPIAIAALFLLAGCGGAVHPNATSRPTANEPPRKIVAAFFAAMHAHDVAAPGHFSRPPISSS